ncbi:hypothetical protein PROFUN_03001 [Planoprotostelium fungivorum]|uniref:Ankyrin repeat protein n=1 Tax=Planoprotostelium fungivorum TaxID=1890364 RepID=A0A2P6NXA2_9EUKA|nr:hypothetical protein PROFUN_03001 [Planoprotostelium fungivorum]
MNEDVGQNDYVDSFTGCLTHHDLLLTVRGWRVDSVHFILDPYTTTDFMLSRFDRIVRLLLADPRRLPRSYRDHTAIVVQRAYGSITSARTITHGNPSLTPRDYEEFSRRRTEGCGDPFAPDNDAIIQAAERHHIEIVVALVRSSSGSIGTTQQGNSSFNVVTSQQYGYSRGRVDPSTHEQGAVRDATHNGHRKVVQLLTANPRMDSSENHNEAVRNAASNGHTEVLSFCLLQH